MIPAAYNQGGYKQRPWNKTQSGYRYVRDAIVIVVSEETGIISMAIEGSLSRNYNYSSLKQELNKQLLSQGQSEHMKLRAQKKSKKTEEDK